MNIYRVRVLFTDVKHKEYNLYNLSWIDAVSKFVFFVQVCLEFPELNIRCVNIFCNGKQKSIKYFQNY